MWLRKFNAFEKVERTTELLHFSVYCRTCGEVTRLLVEFAFLGAQARIKLAKHIVELLRWARAKVEVDFSFRAKRGKNSNPHVGRLTSILRNSIFQQMQHILIRLHQKPSTLAGSSWTALKRHPHLEKQDGEWRWCWEDGWRNLSTGHEPIFTWAKTRMHEFHRSDWDKTLIYRDLGNTGLRISLAYWPRPAASVNMCARANTARYFRGLGK